VNDAVRELFFRGANAFEAGDDAGATAAFQQIVERADVAGDDKAMACVNLATVCNRSNDIDQALAWYEKALSLALERRHVVEESRAMYLASKARYTEAIDGLTRLLQATDLQPADRLRLEHNLAEAQGGRYSGPVTNAVHELFVRGAKAMDDWDYPAAMAAFQQIVDRAHVADDDKAMACVNLATVCDCLNDVDQALDWYERALALALERRHYVEESRAAYLASKARFTEAIDGLTRLLQAPDLRPADRLRLELSLAEARRGRYSPPVNDAGRELFVRGANAFEARDDAAATAAFQQIVDRADVADDDKAMACVNLATVCDRSNDTDQALGLV